MSNEVIYPSLVPNWTNQSKYFVIAVFFIFFIISLRTSYASIHTFVLITILCPINAIRWIVTYVKEKSHAIIIVVDISLKISQ